MMLLQKRCTGLRPACLIAALAAVLFAAGSHAQVVPSAWGPGHSLWAGGEYSNVHAGFPYGSNSRLSGIGAFADFHWTRPIAIEADARFFRFNGFAKETETSYLAGPRYMFRKFGKWQPYAQCLAGVGKIQFPYQIGSGTYFAIAPGGGVNYRVGSRWTVRGEYEYQIWTGSPNFANEPSHEITPNGFHAGISYRPFR